MGKPAWVYIAIAYFITWSIALSGYGLYKAGIFTIDQLNLVYNFGALGPFIGALFAARMFYGAKGVKRLLSTFSFRSISKMSLFISLSPILFLAVGLLIYPIFTGHWFTFGETQRQFSLGSRMSYLIWILPFVTYAFFEELGWRGFLLPHLQGRYTAFKSTFLLTMVWATWHLPFFLWRFQFSWFITIGFFFSIFVGALLLTSSFNFSRGSIVATILFHFTNNLASALDKEYIVAAVSTGFVFLAIYLLRKYKPENLCDTERVKNIYVE